MILEGYDSDTSSCTSTNSDSSKSDSDLDDERLLIMFVCFDVLEQNGRNRKRKAEYMAIRLCQRANQRLQDLLLLTNEHRLKIDIRMSNA